MKILEINITRFGKFSDFTMNFSDGFNIVEGKNESGKSTVQAFIKFILYGLPRRNPAVLIGERERALNWLSGVASGSMTVSDGERRYRIERSGSTGARGAYSEKKRIIDLSDGHTVSETEDAGELFLGIDATAYDSMCNIRQLECTGVDGMAVKNAIENMLTGGDENISADTSLKNLDRERVRLLHKNEKGGLVYELSERVGRLEDEYRKAYDGRKRMLQISDDITRSTVQLQKVKCEREEAEKKCDLYDGVQKLGKFRELGVLKEEKEDTERSIVALDENVRLNGLLPELEDAVRAESAKTELEKAKAELREAEEEKSGLLRRLDGKEGYTGNEEFGQLLSEFSNPQNIVTQINTKVHKRKSTGIAMSLSFACAALLFASAVYLAFVKSLYAGAITLSSLGTVALFVGILFSYRRQRVKHDLGEIMSKLGSDFSEKDTDKIFGVLSDYEKKEEQYKNDTSELNSTEIRLGVARSNAEKAAERAKSVFSRFGQANDEVTESELLDFAVRVREYLADRKELEEKRDRDAVLIKSLSAELEKYSEKQLLEKITPKIEEELKKTTWERLKLGRDAAFEKLNQLNTYKAGKEREYASLEGSTADPEKLLREIDREKKKLDLARLRLDAVNLASSMLSSASENMKREIMPRIKEITGEKMSLMTAGKYSDIGLGEKTELSVFAQGQTRPIEAISKGSGDLAYLSVRLALIEVMCGDGRAPLIMDETFSQLDTERERNAMSVLDGICRDGGQCILFTCRKTDGEIAEEVFGKGRICVNDLDNLNK